MGLAPRSQWDLIADEKMMAEERNLEVLSHFKIQLSDECTWFLIVFRHLGFYMHGDNQSKH